MGMGMLKAIPAHIYVSPRHSRVSGSGSGGHGRPHS